MKKLTRNPLFYTSLVLAILLGFQTYSLVFSAYTPPAGAPPTAGNVAQPLDSGPSLQAKSGALTINGSLIAGTDLTVGQTGAANVIVNPNGQLITFKNSSNDFGNIFYSGGKITIGSYAASSLSFDPTNKVISFDDPFNHASIYYTAAGLAYKNKDGVEHLIGTGTGGAVGWSRNTAMSAVYPTTLGDSVYVGDPAGGLTLGKIRSLSPQTNSPVAHLVMAVNQGSWWQIGTTVNTSGNSSNLFISTGVTADLKRQLTIDSSGNLTAAGTIQSTAGGFKFPDNTIQTTAGSIVNLSKEYTVSGINSQSGPRSSQIDLIPASNGFCFITGVSGDFEGTGESVKIVSGTSREPGHTSGLYWQLVLTSGRPPYTNQELSASARCAGAIDPSQLQGALTPTPTWQDVTVGAGQLDESCVSWLQRIGQLGTKRRVLWPSGATYDDKCTTVGRADGVYGQSSDTASSRSGQPISSVPADTLNYVGTAPGAKTQTLR